MQPRFLLSLLALSLLPVLSCRTAPDKPLILNTGNVKVTVVPKKIAQPKLLITYDSGSQRVFGAQLTATDASFEIQGVEGWYPLEQDTRIEVSVKGSGDRILLIDSKGVPVELHSTVTDLKTDFIANAATGDWYEYDKATNMHKFAVYILFKDAIHVIDVRAKD